MTSYAEAWRVRERYPQDAIRAVDDAARAQVAVHPLDAACDCVGVAALAAALEATEGPAPEVTPVCQQEVEQ